jgi:FAD/FMN-containing dehydrogenase/Fe-S oxidoreductase
MNVDAEALAAKLKKEIEGEVRFDEGGRALYATDGSNYRQTPIGVVIPRNKQDVITTVGLCREFGAPITSRGGGTSLAGQTCNVAVIIDFSKYMNHVLSIDPAQKLGRVQPGCVCDTLRDAAEEHTLTWGPDPATHAWCTLGGMLGNNSCGVHSEMAGRTADNVKELHILTYDGEEMVLGKTSDTELKTLINQGGRKGEIYHRLERLRDRYADAIRKRYPRIPRRVSGYNLSELLPENDFHLGRAVVGSEGTCVVILEALLNLVHSPQYRSLLVLSYPDIFSAGDHVPELREFKPIGLEGVDHIFIEDLRKKGLQLANLELFPAGNAFLLAEFGGDTREEADDAAERCMHRLKRLPHAPEMKTFTDPGKEHRIWHVRESGLGATAHVPGMKENWEGWEDSAVAPDQVGPYLRRLKVLFDKYHYVGSLYGHFGQGCIHTRIDFDLKTAEGVKKFHSFLDDATSLVCEFNGSLSGEHGDGQSRAEFLGKMFGPELIEAFNEFKTIWDPEWKMNPGKIVKPYRADENLRYGSRYKPEEPETYFNYGGDGFSFSKAMERCVGVGKCRRHEAGTMCPSYQATGEEMHSTRGRARLLFEMLRGEVLKDGWRSEPVKEALDLCLACKGCKGECPVHVDMATYKAEFLAHYYEGFRHFRPRHAYAFGYIHNWARIASAAPWLANFFSQTRGFSQIMKAVAGIAPQRQIPAFAKKSFKTWFEKREIRNRNKPRVILWPDTFNNYFHPYVAQAAVEALEDAGLRVMVPRQNMCCGRPLYDFGFLKSARRYLLDILNKMAAEIEDGVPFIVLEPSCCSVFRDELMNLLPHNQNAARLNRQTFTLSEFLTQKVSGYRAPILETSALLHGHCHQKAVLKIKAEEELLRRMKVDYTALDAGCCGMAGAFGFEKGDHYEVSIKCGERVLLPRARDMGREEILITDGFSCHEQVLQQTGREPLHMAQVLQRALKSGKREEAENPKKQAKHSGNGRHGHNGVGARELTLVHAVGHGHGRFRWAAPAGVAALAATAVITLMNDRHK